MEERIITAEQLAQAQRFGDFVPVYKVDASTIVKTGDSVRLAEAEAMKLVHQKTTIPVPKVYNAYIDTATGHARIVMEFVQGDVLADVWDKFNGDQKQEVLAQLRGFLSQLREMKGSLIGSVDGTACEDQLFSDEPGAYGPYQDEAAFNEGIVAALKNTQTSGWVDTVSNMVLALKGHEIVMTHGDLCPRNVLVQGTRVTAILDWEMAGYYPAYWEYVKALYRPAWESSWIKDQAIDKILDSYPLELAVLLHANSIGAW
ncbi:phosphotransferase enzyme family protein-like protein [Amniculicola lignicola CBS 123094]|uniref:Phosphotransferase enzyme family protein-like protein n=1 Tax=Amniculicola lignicola CBS 123094 TaxID=1392246 RepID=A0A6A5W5B4_9PLEO|nr:phosphotransferase enzyme family protein-like protein [Amniculicola lignicola CBS 123094]